MPITNPSEASVFNADYGSVSSYVGDGELIPHFNPADSGVLIRKGEPVLKFWGAAGEERVFLAQAPIRPGEIGYLIRPGQWVADFACDVSANVVQGQEVYWDLDAEEVSLAADVTNGFPLGSASYGVGPEFKSESLSVDANGRVIVATTASTKIRVVGEDDVTQAKGTVSSY